MDFENNQAPQQPYAPVQPQQAPYQAPVQQAPYQAPYQAPVAPQQAPALPQANKGKSKLPLIIGVVAVVAIVAIVISLIGGGGYKKAVENVVACWLDYETDNIESLLPDAVWEEIADDMDMDKDELIDEYIENMEENKEMAEEYNYEVTYEIGEYEKMDKDDLEDLKEDITDIYDCIDEDDIGNKAYTVEVEYEKSYSYDGEEDSYDGDIDLCVIKIDGKWYVVSEDGYFFAD